MAISLDDIFAAAEAPPATPAATDDDMYVDPATGQMFCRRGDHFDSIEGDRYPLESGIAFGLKPLNDSAPEAALQQLADDAPQDFYANLVNSWHSQGIEEITWGHIAQAREQLRITGADLPTTPVQTDEPIVRPKTPGINEYLALWDRGHRVGFAHDWIDAALNKGAKVEVTEGVVTKVTKWNWENHDGALRNVWDAEECRGLQLLDQPVYFNACADDFLNSWQAENFMEEVNAMPDEPAAVVDEAPVTAKGAGDYSVRLDTGEIVDLHWFLQKCGFTELPQSLTEAQAEKISDVIAGYRGDAARYREQADRLAKPKDNVADAIQSFYAQLLFKHYSDRLPKVKKTGEIKAWYVDTPTARISFENMGGVEVFDGKAYDAWKAEMVGKGKAKELGIAIDYHLGKDRLNELVLGKEAKGESPAVAPLAIPGVKKASKVPVAIKKVE